MATSTKYQRAPQEDPEDYTNAPPAYGEGSSARNDETQGLFAGGAPRSSEDNIPDDFKVWDITWTSSAHGFFVLCV